MFFVLWRVLGGVAMDGIRGSGCLVQDVSRVGIVQWVGGESVVSCCSSRRGASTKHNNNK